MAASIATYRFIILLLIVAAAGAEFLKVDFTKPLNADTLTSATYTTFLKELRQKLASTYSKNVPVLPVFSKENPRGFEVTLTAGSNTVPVRFRSDNLYLVGFQMQTGTRAWYEFGKKKNNPPRLIQGSEFLEFDGDYPELEGIAGTVTSMEINKKAFIDAVGVLAVSLNKGDRAKAVVVLVQMISEAARFLDVSNHFATNLAKNAKLPSWMRYDLENNWASLSSEVLKADAYPCYKFKPPTINGKKVETVEALRLYFGILYRDPATLKPPCTSSLYDETMSAYGFEARRFGAVMVAQA